MGKDNFIFFLQERNSKHFSDTSYLTRETEGKIKFINHLIEVKANPRKHYSETMFYTGVTNKYLY